MYYIDKIKKHLNNWGEYAKEHLIRIIFITILFVFFCFILTLFPRVFDGGEQHVLILGITLSNWSIWIGIVGIICTAIWAIYEFDKSRISTQQEKASEIAKSFADKLTLKCMLICNVYEYSPLGTLLDLKNKDCFAFNSFTTNEIRTIYESDDYLDKYKTLKSCFNLDILYYNILESRISVQPIDEIIAKHKSYNNKQARNLFILDNEGLPFKFNYLVQDVLNELEYLCMGLASQAAGSSYVYQSLHQVFLRTIRVLAIEIALSNNSSYSDKYYTNIIEVYNQWKLLYSKSLKSEAKTKNKVEKILNPKIKTV